MTKNIHILWTIVTICVFSCVFFSPFLCMLTFFFLSKGLTLTIYCNIVKILWLFLSWYTLSNTRFESFHLYQAIKKKKKVNKKEVICTICYKPEHTDTDMNVQKEGDSCQANFIHTIYNIFLIWPHVLFCKCHISVL